MKVQAIAVSSERSNAIGSVELECTQHGLVITYLGVGAFSEGYAPGALTHGTLVTVPYSGITTARLEGERLYLELVPDATPHNRLLLQHFSARDGTHLHEMYRQRLILRVGAFSFAFVAAIATTLTLQRFSPSTGAMAAALVGGTSALTVLLVGFILDRRIVSGALEGLVARDAFANELGMYFPGLIRNAQAPPKKETPPLPDFQRLLPRTLAAVVITLTAGGLSAVLVSSWLIKRPDTEGQAAVADLEPTPIAISEPEPAPVEPLPAAAPVQPAPPRPAPDKPKAKPKTGGLDQLTVAGQCSCKRADSVLWQAPIPKLSVLVLSTKLRQKGRRKHLEVDIAVVNNSDEQLSDVTLRVNFYERDRPPSNRRHFSKHRVLYFEGPLVPGQAIKWTTEARGVEFELENPVAGDLGPNGEGAAPTDALAELLNANHRPVRLHGAMMLAYLGDPRAREGALKLQDALRDEEADYLRRVLAALADVHACNLQVTGAGNTRNVEACVYNAGSAPKGELAVRINALADEVSHSHPTAEPPNVLGESAWALPGELAPRTGVRVKTQFDLRRAKAEAAKAFEIVTGREDLVTGQ